MRYERDYYRGQEGFRGFDRSPYPNRGYGYRDMERYESDYRFSQPRHFGARYDRGFGEDTTRVFRPSRGGYDRGYRGGYDRGYGSSHGSEWTAPRPSFYGQGEINRWSSPGRNPFPGMRTGFATGYGMGHGRFL